MPDISKWNLSNIININGLFAGCLSLKELPDISKWNLNNIFTLKNVFSYCYSLISLPDISKWNIINLNKNISTLESKFNYENEHEFDIQKNPEYNKSYDKYLYLKKSFHLIGPEPISIEDLKENILSIAYNMNGLFSGCLSLKELPHISKWNLSNVKYI